MAKYKIGSKVEWKWGAGFIEGRVAEIFTETVRKVIKGKTITRHGTKECPAYYIELERNRAVLKLERELYSADRAHGWV